MSQLVSTRPRTRRFTRQQEELNIKRRKEADDIILYEDFDGRTQIISMKQMEEGIINEDLDGRTKIITTNKQKEEDIINEDLDGRTKIIEDQNSKMNNATKKDHKLS